MPLDIVNHDRAEYQLKITQDGQGPYYHPIEPSYEKPDNEVSVNNPSWPVHLEIFTDSGVEFYNQEINSDAPHVDIYKPTNSTNGSDVKPTVKVS